MDNAVGFLKGKLMELNFKAVVSLLMAADLCWRRSKQSTQIAKTKVEYL